jgi:hypothetical protein
VSKTKVEAEELAKTKVWDAIHAEIVAKSPLARTDTKIKESNRAEIERETSAKNKVQAELQVIAQSVLDKIEKVRGQAEAEVTAKAKSQTNNNAAAAAAKSKTTTNAESLKTIQPGSQADEFNIFEVIRTVKKNAMASAVQGERAEDQKFLITTPA